MCLQLKAPLEICQKIYNLNLRSALNLHSNPTNIYKIFDKTSKIVDVSFIFPSVCKNKYLVYLYYSSTIGSMFKNYLRLIKITYVHYLHNDFTVSVHFGGNLFSD